MGQLITDMEQVTPTWLTEVLQEQGCLERGTVIAVEKSVQPMVSSVVANLKLTYSDDTPVSAPSNLFLKISSPDFRSNLYTAHYKEIEFYKTVAPNMVDSPAARCYDAVYCLETDQSHLLLEDLSETHYRMKEALPPLPHQCAQAIDSLAKLHAFWWDHPQLGSEFGTLLDVQGFIQAFGLWLPGFLDFASDRLFASERQLYEKVAAGLPRLWERYLQQRFAERKGLTLVHTDLHLNNFLLPHDPGRDKTRIVDWETWSVYIGPHDLAYAIVMGWYSRRRSVVEQDLVKQYHAGLLKYGVKDYAWDDCWRDYRLSLIVGLFSPVLRWAIFDDDKDGWWWGALERTMSAFEDLNCIELLD